MLLQFIMASGRGQWAWPVNLHPRNILSLLVTINLRGKWAPLECAVTDLCSRVSFFYSLSMMATFCLGALVICCWLLLMQESTLSQRDKKQNVVRLSWKKLHNQLTAKTSYSPKAVKQVALLQRTTANYSPLQDPNLFHLISLYFPWKTGSLSVLK